MNYKHILNVSNWIRFIQENIIIFRKRSLVQGSGFTGYKKMGICATMEIRRFEDIEAWQLAREHALRTHSSSLCYSLSGWGKRVKLQVILAT